MSSPQTQTAAPPAAGLDARAVQALAALAHNTVKTAQDLQARLAAAPKPADPAVLEKAAGVLVSHHWLTPDQKADAIAALADPTSAADLVYNLTLKAAEAIETARGGNNKLAAGTPVSAHAPTRPATRKVAADARFDGESDADQQFLQRMLAKRVHTA